MTQKGYAPWAPKLEKHRGLETFILHHVQPISQGGAVYDIDNIRVVTPKAHQTIHSKVKS